MTLLTTLAGGVIAAPARRIPQQTLIGVGLLLPAIILWIGGA